MTQSGSNGNGKRVDLKIVSRELTEGASRAPARSYLHAVGITNEDLDTTPLIGIASTWNEFSPCQANLKTVADHVTLWMVARYDATNPPALRRLVAGGAVLKAFSRPILDACYDAAMQTYDESAAESPAFKKRYASWRQFAADEHLWFRIAENSFENFVYPKSQKT